MPFKETTRVVYKKNPLIEVICQLRFPRILAINEISPVAFQEKIRCDYPLFEVRTEQQQQFSLEVTEDSPTPLPKIVRLETTKNFKFSSADGIWSINLTGTFLSLSTSTYTTWEDFEERLKNPLAALLEIYQPSFFERVGLRYVDAFQRSKLELESSSWNELIQPFALGFLSNVDVADEVKGFSSVSELEIGDDAQARINTALGYVGSVNLPIHAEQSELSFIVDSDMYYGKKNIAEISTSLKKLHEMSSRFMRAIITEKLHFAMEPGTL